jgi:hypothetical protein
MGALKLGAIKLGPAIIAEKPGDNQRVDPDAAAVIPMSQSPMPRTPALRTLRAT